ncbi:MAG: hypothetical protein ACRCW0_01855 [Clostridium sp.]
MNNYEEIISLYAIKSENIIEIENSDYLEVLLKSYSEKFAISAHMLISYVLKSNDISKLDIDFFSVAYLFRHSIELISKAVVFKYIKNTEERCEFLKSTKHNVYDILLVIKNYVKEDIKINEEPFNWLLKLFLDINDIDRDSDSFRYPFKIITKKCLNKKVYSIQTVFQKETRINLETFGNKMITAYKLLESLYNGNYKKFKIEINLNSSFLEKGGTYYGQSVLGYKFSQKDYYPYVRAYSESAEYFYKIIKNSDSYAEYLFIPMCYLYRNAVELALKEILFKIKSITYKRTLKLINSKKHKVVSLWNSIKDEVEVILDPSKGNNTVEIISKYLNEINNIDPKADLFRYPFDKNCNVYLQNKKFDVENVNGIFKEILCLLNGVEGNISYYNDMLSYYC